MNNQNTNEDWSQITYKDLMKQYSDIIKEELPSIYDDEIYIAIYFFALYNYHERGCLNHQILCNMKLEWCGSPKEFLEDFPAAIDAIKILENHFKS